MIYSIHTTCSSEKEAENIAKTLLDKNLIACANMFPVRSLYNWKGKLSDEQEFYLVMKTSKKSEVIQKIKELHSYDLPCIISHQVEANQDYATWVEETTK